MASYQFPEGFVWGAATAAAQIEGASRSGGKGESIWDHFAAQPGNVKNGDTPEVACDHYHRYEADFDLMRDSESVITACRSHGRACFPGETDRSTRADSSFIRG